MGSPATLGQSSNLYQVGFDAAWELDVFGGNRRAVEAAEALLEASELDWAAVLVTLLGEVGGDYVNYRSLQQRIRIANNNVKTQQDTLALTRRLFAAGLATDLDVARAERQLAAATAAIGVVVRDRYPRFFVTGFGALQSISASSLFDWPSGAGSIGPTVSWIAFDAGMTRAAIGLRTAEQQELLAGYRSVVLQAFQEVEAALVAYAQGQKRRDDLAIATASNQRAADLAVRLYVQWLTDFLSVLQAQFNLLRSQDALAQGERDIALDLVALYKALGGGWQSAPAMPAYDGAAAG